MSVLDVFDDQYWPEIMPETKLEIQWDRARQDAVQELFTQLDEADTWPIDCRAIAKSTAEEVVDLSGEWMYLGHDGELPNKPYDIIRLNSEMLSTLLEATMTRRIRAWQAHLNVALLNVELRRDSVGLKTIKVGGKE